MKRRLEFINSNNIILTMRLIKSDTEIELLKKSWQICDTGYSAVLNSNIVGLIEIQAAGISEKAARDAGAESITFNIFASGKRKPRLWDVDSPRPRQVSFAPLPKYLLRRERI